MPRHALASRKGQHLHAQIGTLGDQLVTGDRAAYFCFQMMHSVSKMSFRNFTTGKSHEFGGEYVELLPGERLRYTDKFDDPNLPGDMQVTVTLKKVSVGTEVDITQAGVPDAIPWQGSSNPRSINSGSGSSKTRRGNQIGPAWSGVASQCALEV
jgi:hypothetical protein